MQSCTKTKKTLPHNQPSNDDEEARILAERANQQKEHRQQREELLNQSFGSFSGDNEGDIDYIDTGEDVMEDGEITPTQKEPDEFTKVKSHRVCIGGSIYWHGMSAWQT